MSKEYEHGFTVIELLVVAALFVTFASMALVKANGSVEKAELENSARLLASDLRLLQQLSVNSDGTGAKEYSIVFNNAKPYGYRIIDGMKSVKSVTFPSHVVINASPSPMYFSDNGAPRSNGNSRTISLSSNTIQQFRYVIIAGASGRVRVSDKDASE